ncbi:hypothetical protein [Providencia sp. SP181]|uniref:hypothetical protein n=1 Tax=Providencia sp. SP181 TaxID=3136277 RepID=UPI003D2E05A9
MSGYLPSFVDINSGPRGGAVGVRDITALTDQAGAPIADITDAGPGATTFTIAASGKNARGQDVNGKLVLKGTELRAVRGATAPDEGNNNGTLRIMMAATSQLAKPTPRGSCFSGSGAYANAKDVLGGTATNPTAGTASATAYQALFSAFDAADAQGTAPRYATIKNSRYGTDAISTDFSGSGCNVATTWNGVRATSDKWSYLYIAGAHVLELTPLSLKFSEPLSGAWSSTLTVTAYQM